MRRIIHIVKIVILIVVAAAVIYILSDALEPNLEGNRALGQFYDLEDNQVEVLAVGSSHVHSAVNTATLWEEAGIAAFDLSGNGTSIQLDYYLIREALKTQKPKLIMVDTSFLTEGPVEFGWRYSHFSNMKLSKNKIEGIKDCFDKNDQWKVLLEFPVTHENWKTLSKDSFTKETLAYPYTAHMYMGSALLAGTEEKDEHILKEKKKEIKHYTYPKRDKKTHLSEENQTYMKKIIELCKEENVELVFTVNPCHPMPNEVSMIEEAENIASENGIQTINFCKQLDSMGINDETDWYNATHLNIDGSVSFSRYLAGYLKEHYELTDYRGNPAYVKWDENVVDLYQQLQL